MILVASNGLPGLHRVAVWFNDPGNWWGPSGLLARLGEHVVYSLILVLVALVVALPLGVLIGHSGRGVALLAGAANGLRAIPSFGLLLFLIVLLSPRIHVTSGFTGLIARGSVPYLVPAMIVLVVVAVPPILTSTYAGIQSVDRGVRDGARGAGMNALQVMTKVELPCALPLIMSGIRNATLEVIATLTVAAYAPLVGGLGRLIVDGDQNLSDLRYGYPAMLAAGITIAVLALVADTLLALVQRSIVSPGISGRYSPKGTFKRSVIRTPIHATAHHPRLADGARQSVTYQGGK
jgi:osmoprotectant transport system permease protein